MRLSTGFPILGSSATSTRSPLTRFAVLQIRMQRVDRLSPHGVAFHWGTMATLALAIVGTMFVASIHRPFGSRIERSLYPSRRDAIPNFRIISSVLRKNSPDCRKQTLATKIKLPGRV